MKLHPGESRIADLYEASRFDIDLKCVAVVDD